MHACVCVYVCACVVSLKVLSSSGAFLEKPMKEAIPSALVGVEIFCWFIFGEIIGRKSIIGYKV